MAFADQLSSLFKLKSRNATIRGEFRGAVATFLTMSYILVANPEILRSAGIPFGSAVACTALAAGVSCLLMGLVGNFPVALASGMGLNSVVAFQLVGACGSWQKAMGLVVLDGVVVLFFVAVGFRESVMRAIPRDLKLAIASGIGIFITFIGLLNAKLVRVPDGTLIGLRDNPASVLPPVSFGSLRSPETLVAFVGLLLTVVSMAKRIRGAIILGIAGSTLLAIPFGLVRWTGQWGWPNFELAFGADVFGALRVSFIPLLLSLIMVDFFDTLGTITALAQQAGLSGPQGRIPRLKAILALDALSASIGGMLGVSSITSYIESSAGIAEGARTGLHTVFVGLFFLLAIFLAPLASLVPQAATSAALISIGFLMSAQIKMINFDDMESAIPAFLILIGIPLTFSISHGIGLGFISYVVMKVLGGNAKKVSLIMYILSAVFVAHFVWV